MPHTDPASDRNLVSGESAEEEQRFLLFGRIADEVKECVREGREPDIDAYVAEHPHWGDEIRELIGTLGIVNALGPQRKNVSSNSGVTTSAASDVPRELGDYRIIREVGRGGMGVVYEAEQISLQRQVALKVLPFAVLDGRQLKRFKNEALAAAQLHHTNIVPVYSVGCERGIHYYAMQYIEGQTLARMIGELQQVDQSQPGHQPSPPSKLTADLLDGRFARQKTSAGPAETTISYREHAEAGEVEQPADAAGTTPNANMETRPESGISTSRSRTAAYYRTVAQLGVQAAEALEHAHTHGIVHRDIKPANLILDESGNLWIADFGLARLQDDSSLTMSGDILGTLRYMSPEQALGRREQVDHRCDIYSLGITLYELLTLRPAFSGDNRQRLLQQVASEDVRAPRRIEPGIPRDLETVVLKAASKDPAERYASAQELADDLRRCLDDRPIAARRPGPLVRAFKWVRRHKTVSAATLCVLVSISIAGAFGWIAHERQLRELAADNRARDARVNALVEEAIRYSQGIEPDYERAVDLFTEALRERPEDSLLFLLRGRAHYQSGRYSDAITDLELSLNIQPERNPGAHWLLAVIYREQNEAERADMHEAEALKDAPDAVEALVAQALALSGEPQSLEFINRALQQQPFDPRLYYYRGTLRKVLIFNRIGTAVHDADVYWEVIADFERALHARPRDDLIAKELLSCFDFDDPSDREYLDRLLEPWMATATETAQGQLLLAEYYSRLHDNVRAEEHGLEAYRLEPDNVSLVTAVGRYKFRQRDFNAAIAWFSEALDMDPDHFAARVWLASSYARLGRVEEAKREQEEATRRVFPSERAITGWPLLISTYMSLGELDAALEENNLWVNEMPNARSAYRHRARVYRRLDRPDNALADYARCIEISPQVADVYLERAALYEELDRLEVALSDYNTAVSLGTDERNAYAQRSQFHARQGNWETAVADWQELASLDPELAARVNDRNVAAAEQSGVEQAIQYVSLRIAATPDPESYLKRARLRKTLLIQRHGPSVHDGDVYREVIADFEEALHVRPLDIHIIEELLGCVDYSDPREKAQLERLIEPWIASSPQGPKAHSLLAWHYAHSGDVERAESHLLEAIRQQPEDAGHILELGLLRSQQGDLNGAVERFTQALRMNPRMYHAQIHRAHCLARLGKVDDAKRDLEEVTSRIPPNRRGSVTWGFLIPAYEAVDDYDGALEQYAYWIELMPGMRSPYQRRARLYRRLDRPDDALSDYVRCIEIAPEAADVYLDRADLYEELGRFVEAQADFDTAVSLETDDRNAYARRCQFHARQENWEAAIADWRELDTLDPNLASSVNDRIFSELQNRITNSAEDVDVEQILAFLAYQIELRPDFVSPYRHRARLYEKLGQMDAALADLDQCVKKDEQTARHYVARGELKLRTGRVEAAFTDIHRAIALDRDLTNRMAWRLVATDPGERKQIEFALELALQAASARPDNGAIQNTLGVAEYRAGLLDDARATLQTAIELSGDANYSFNAFFLAMIHHQQGDAETAREFYDKAVAWMQEHAPDNKELQQFRAEAEAVLADSTD